MPPVCTLRKDIPSFEQYLRVCCLNKYNELYTPYICAQFKSWRCEEEHSCPKQATTVSGNLPEKAEPKWLNEEEREGWLFISSIIFNLTRQLDNQLQQDADLSYVEYMVLVGLSESEDHELTMTQLALATNTLPARLSRVVARLEKDGYVSRSLSAEDRRVSICHLLPQGLQKLQDAAPGHVAQVRHEIFDHLTEDQVRALANIGESILGDTPSKLISSSSLRRGSYPA